jgi:hypothetical protein
MVGCFALLVPFFLAFLVSIYFLYTLGLEYFGLQYLGFFTSWTHPEMHMVGCFTLKQLIHWL